MLRMKHHKSIFHHLIVLLVIMFFFGGCSVFSQKKKDTASQPSAEQVEENVPLYYDFGDVPVPKELKLDTKSSFIYRTSGFSAGVLVLKGAVEFGSLIEFFENNMAKDNWRIISTFKSQRTLLLFQKETRWCVINITDDKFNTHVEIWVAPTTNPTESGLLK